MINSIRSRLYFKSVPIKQIEIKTYSKKIVTFIHLDLNDMKKHSLKENSFKLYFYALLYGITFFVAFYIGISGVAYVVFWLGLAIWMHIFEILTGDFSYFVKIITNYIQYVTNTATVIIVSAISIIAVFHEIGKFIMEQRVSKIISKDRATKIIKIIHDREQLKDLTEVDVTRISANTKPNYFRVVEEHEWELFMKDLRDNNVEQYVKSLPEPSAAESSTYLADKNCSACGESVPLDSHAGETCPHCGVYWSSETTKTMN